MQFQVLPCSQQCVINELKIKALTDFAWIKNIDRKSYLEMTSDQTKKVPNMKLLRIAARIQQAEMEPHMSQAVDQRPSLEPAVNFSGILSTLL
jgi:hypothetical protein